MTKSRNINGPKICSGLTSDEHSVIGATEQFISSVEELISIVGRMELSSIQDWDNFATLFTGRLNGHETFVSFDFHKGYGVLRHAVTKKEE